MSQPHPSLSADQLVVWNRARAQIEAIRAEEITFAQKLKRDLIRYPGYYEAARKRAQQLLLQHRNRPHLHWAAQEWITLFEKGGRPAILEILEANEQNQELISASPFTVMRPPLPENNYYQQHESA
jgi:hypothetical protein